MLHPRPAHSSRPCTRKVEAHCLVTGQCLAPQWPKGQIGWAQVAALSGDSPHESRWARLTLWMTMPAWRPPQPGDHLDGDNRHLLINKPYNNIRFLLVCFSDMG